MKPNPKKSAAEVRALREEIDHLETTRQALIGLKRASEDVAGAVEMLRQVRATEDDPRLLARAEQARADATEVFSMANVTATTVWLERTSWEGQQAHRATIAQGQRLTRVTWVLAGSTGVLALATLGLIWATLAA